MGAVDRDQHGANRHHQQRQAGDADQQFDQALILGIEKPVSVPAVAGAADVSKGGLLYHFPSREALVDGLVARLEALLDDDVERMTSAVDGVVDYFIRTSSRSAIPEDDPLDRCITAVAGLGASGRWPQAVSALTAMQDRWYRVVLDEVGDPVQRPRLLDAFVEIALEAGDRSGAGAAAAELSAVADDASVPLLAAIADRAEGAVRLADGRAEAALPLLRRAFRQWQAVHAPYEAARSRVLIGLAARELGDEATATLEIEAARDSIIDLYDKPLLPNWHTLLVAE